MVSKLPEKVSPDDSFFKLKDGVMTSQFVPKHEKQACFETFEEEEKNRNMFKRDIL